MAFKGGDIVDLRDWLNKGGGARNFFKQLESASNVLKKFSGIIKEDSGQKAAKKMSGYYDNLIKELKNISTIKDINVLNKKFESVENAAASVKSGMNKEEILVEKCLNGENLKEFKRQVEMVGKDRTSIVLMMNLGARDDEKIEEKPEVRQRSQTHFS